MLDPNFMQGIQRAQEIDRIAAEGGYVSAMNPRFAADHPELASEYSDLSKTLVMASGGGMVGPVSSSAASAAGSMLGHVMPPGAAPRVQAALLPGAMPHPQAPAGGQVPNVNTTVGGGAPPRPPGPPPPPAPPVGAPPPPPGNGGPGVIVPRPALGAGTPPAVAAPAGPGWLGQIAAAVRRNPGKAGLVAAGLGAAGIYAANQAGATPPPAPDAAPEPPAAPMGPTQAQINTAQQTDADIRAKNAEAKANEAQAAELERRMHNANMTDEQKEAARRELQKLQDDAAMAREQTSQAGANARTATTEAGATRRQEISEAGANTRAGFTGAVDMRGQDQRAREAQDQFVTQTVANLLEQGKISVDKANKQMEAYFKQAKLPTEILEGVSRSISPFLPYMTGRKAGESMPGFEDGGPFAQMVKQSGGKYDPSTYANRPVNIDLSSIAAQYGAKTNQAPIPTVDQVFAGAGDQALNLPPEAQIRSQSASAGPLPRPQFGASPQSPVDGLMPKTMVPPMSPEDEQKILQSLQ